MDRERKDELPQMQVGFIDVVCRPLYTTLSESFPWIRPLLDGCLANREKWADLAEKVSRQLEKLYRVSHLQEYLDWVVLNLGSSLYLEGCSYPLPKKDGKTAQI